MKPIRFTKFCESELAEKVKEMENSGREKEIIKFALFDLFCSMTLQLIDGELNKEEEEIRDDIRILMDGKYGPYY